MFEQMKPKDIKSLHCAPASPRGKKTIKHVSGPSVPRRYLSILLVKQYIRSIRIRFTR